LVEIPLSCSIHTAVHKQDSKTPILQKHPSYNSILLRGTKRHTSIIHYRSTALLLSSLNYKNVYPSYFIYKNVIKLFYTPLIITQLTFWHNYDNTDIMENPFYIESDFEIKKHGQTFLNEKRIKLLKAIKNNGSIRSASSDIKMSYQQAWHFIKEMNELSPLPLVVNKRGGSNGGGTELTRHGELAVEEFEKLTEKIKSANKKFSDTLWICDFF